MHKNLGHLYTTIHMALELQNDEQQRTMSDNLSIRASNRLAAGNLSTQESIQRVQRDVGTGVDTFGTGKALTKGYGLAKDVKAAGVGAYAADQAGRFTSTRGVTALKDTVSLGKGFTPGKAPAAEGAAESAEDAAARSARVLPGFRSARVQLSLGGESEIGSNYASATKGVTPAAGEAPSLTTAAAAGDEAAMTAGDALKVGGKALGVLGGAVDAVEDIAHGGLYGNNMEKAGNVLTIASTVLDFVPGLEWLGVAGNVAATVLGAAGDAEEDKKQTASDAQQQSADTAPSEAGSNITVSQRSAPDASRSQMPASNTF